MSTLDYAPNAPNFESLLKQPEFNVSQESFTVRTLMEINVLSDKLKASYESTDIKL